MKYATFTPLTDADIAACLSDDLPDDTIEVFSVGPVNVTVHEYSDGYVESIHTSIHNETE